jgi:hypothetical protein
MMDGTPIPTAAVGQPSEICLFCHQGRDSGYTLYRKYSQLGFDYFTNTTAVTNGTMNITVGGTQVTPSNGHHFSGGGTLWSKNAYEFTFNGTTPATYSNGIPAHQAMNCVGCHMAPVTDTVITNTTTGGHTFKPQVAVCLTCHSSSDINNVTTSDSGVANVSVPFINVTLPASLGDVDGDPTTTTVYQTIGDYNNINWAVAPKPTDQGLFNLIRYAFYLNNVEMDNGSYYKRINPYNQKTNHVKANALVLWTAGEQQAAWNIDTLQNAQSGNAVYVHNFYYVAQVLLDSLQALGMTKNPSTGTAFTRPTTPAANGTYPAGTTRPATNYSQIIIP